jgi:hypothetical protein
MRSVLRTLFIYAAALVIATLSPAVAAGGSAHSRHWDADPGLLVSGLGSGSGSTVGPDGSLYVAQPAAGTIARVNPRTGASSTFASGLPTRLPGFPVGGVTDVAFLGHTAYALVSVVGPDVGGTATVGLYRIDRHGTPTVVVDIGAWSTVHPPSTPYFIPSGVQYALQPWHGGFLVTDGHHNRVLRVTRHGDISALISFGNVVPTGIDIGRRSIFVALAGPVPHDPADGRIVAFSPGSTVAEDVASGASILTDVELAHRSKGHHRDAGRHGERGKRLYAISNGTYSGDPEGSPGKPDTGALVKANRNGGFDVVASDLDRPTSLEIIRGNAYVVTYDGEVWALPLGR